MADEILELLYCRHRGIVRPSFSPFSLLALSVWRDVVWFSDGCSGGLGGWGGAEGAVNAPCLGPWGRQNRSVGGAE